MLAVKTITLTVLVHVTVTLVLTLLKSKLSLTIKLTVIRALLMTSLLKFISALSMPAFCVRQIGLLFGQLRRSVEVQG